MPVIKISERYNRLVLLLLQNENKYPYGIRRFRSKKGLVEFLIRNFITEETQRDPELKEDVIRSW